ncbi:Gfo/Idh/MocA family oxidoreductase, partial [Micrococcus luteus]
MSRTDAPIRTALIGYGFAGKTFHVPLLHATEGLALTHVASSRPDAVHTDLPDVVVVPDVDALLAHHDVDLVVIAAPNDQHTPLARAALRAGRHVVVDKPFTLSLAEARELRDLAAE